MDYTHIFITIYYKDVPCMDINCGKIGNLFYQLSPDYWPYSLLGPSDINIKFSFFCVTAYWILLIHVQEI